MSYILKQVAEKDYIEFYYDMDEVFGVMKMKSQTFVQGLLAGGKIKDPTPYTLTDDNEPFFNYSCKAAEEVGFGIMAQLSREIINIIPCTIFDTSNREIKLRVGYKSTINEAALTTWDAAIKDYLVAYVLRDWYDTFGLGNDAGLPAKTKILFDIAWNRSISDLKWLAIGTVEEARLSLEEGFKEYEDEFLVTK